MEVLFVFYTLCFHKLCLLVFNDNKLNAYKLFKLKKHIILWADLHLLIHCYNQNLILNNLLYTPVLYILGYFKVFDSLNYKYIQRLFI